ncbi:MAG: hypothetical protein ABJE95_00465 [Byssovorax sp.]
MRDAKGLMELTMMVETNGSLVAAHEYFHQGQMYVEGIDGSRYALRVKNLTGARVLMVMSVDGLDVASGEEASFSCGGMVLTAQRTYDFEGYRLDKDAVATFRFGGVGGSYAAQMGKPRNIGVIGAALFEELVPPPPPPPPPVIHGPPGGYPPPMAPPGFGPPMAGGAPPPPFAASAFGGPPPAPMAAPSPVAARAPVPTPGAPRVAPAAQSLGTAFGERREAKITSTTFERATTSPATVISLRYEHREALRALGIPIDDLATRETANPFPAEPGPFAKPPPGWRG